VGARSVLPSSKTVEVDENGGRCHGRRSLAPERSGNKRVVSASGVSNSKKATLTFRSWNNYYQNDLDNQGDGDESTEYVSELESWFDDVGAPAKTLSFLTSDTFPLSPSRTAGSPPPSVLDVGTGNGSALFSLRLDGGFTGPMVGVDYSEQSITLARELWKRLRASHTTEYNDISFAVFDVIHDNPKTASWWNLNSQNGFDLVLDKGTFDAISLSSEIISLPDGSSKKVFEVYPQKVGALVKPGGYFLITSCNWTQEEIVKWFTGEGMEGILEVFHVIEYPAFKFGGKMGQGVVSVCFRKVDRA
jgi:EEF1A lysine methyltransferase 2